MSSFNKRLKKAMDDANMRQADLCNETGILRSLMSEYVNGKVKPKIDNLILIAKALNVSPSWLLFGDEESQLVTSRKKNIDMDKNLKDYTRIVVETDEETPVTIATITEEETIVADGYRVRLTPTYH